MPRKPKPIVPITPAVLSLNDVAEVLGQTPTYVRTWFTARDSAAKAFGGARLFTLDSIVETIRLHRLRPLPHAMMAALCAADVERRTEAGFIGGDLYLGEDAVQRAQRLKNTLRGSEFEAIQRALATAHLAYLDTTGESATGYERDRYEALVAVHPDVVAYVFGGLDTLPASRDAWRLWAGGLLVSNPVHNQDAAA